MNGTDAEPKRDVRLSPGRQAELFESTSHQAREAAARNSPNRYTRILEVLREGPACIFQVATRIGCFDHQISGRFGELERRGAIAKTGQRKRKPETGCEAEVYRLAETPQ